MPRVDNSPRSPCWQQEQIARQNAYLDSVAAHREVVYAPPCKIDPTVPAKIAPAPAPAKVAAAPKAS